MLPKSYVIFLCLEDIFGRNLPVYTFNNVCQENKGINLGDETYKIFFNARMYDTMKSEEEKSFFNYLCYGKAASAFTRNLDELMSRAKHNAQWRHQFMTWEQEVNISYHNGVDDGIKQGIKQGIEQGIERGIKQGIERGIEEGEHKNAIETAKNCLKEGLPLETISKLVGLSIEEIREIEKDNK